MSTETHSNEYMKTETKHVCGLWIGRELIYFYEHIYTNNSLMIIFYILNMYHTLHLFVLEADVEDASMPEVRTGGKYIWL